MSTYNFTLLVEGIDESRLDDVYEATDGSANVEIGDPLDQQRWLRYRGQEFWRRGPV